MTTLKFVDTHNMVAFLSKPAESEGFEQIVDFLNANPINYALTINPTIYSSCIKKFWSTVKAKTVNGEVQLQALVDGKKVIIIESIIRRDLQLEDAEGTDCLPNATIFEQLTLIGAKTTAWNEFSSTMAFAIICLATNQKFNFSKYIFESMVKNLDNVNKFLMYPRFVQVFLDQQVGEMSTHNKIYVTPSHTKKIFGNMRRVGKGFSGRETPLFQTMVVQDQADMGEGSTIPTDPHHTPTIIETSTSQPQKTQKPRKPKRKNTKVPQPSGSTEHVVDEVVYKEMDDSLVRAATTASSLEAEQDSSNINKTQSKATLNEPSSPRTSSSRGPRCQETMGDTIAQTRFENVSKTSNDSLLTGGRKIDDINNDVEITLVDETQVRYGDDLMLETCVLDGDEVFVAKQSEHVVEEVVDVAQTITTEEITLAQALAELRSTKVSVVNASTKVSTATITTATIPTPRKGIVIQEVGTTTKTTNSLQQQSQEKVQDKGKAKMVELEISLKKKDQIRLDEELALKLQAKEEEEARLAREKAQQIEEANVALIIEWNDIQAKIEVNQLLAERLQAREQEELTIEERAKLFKQLLEKRKKHFATKRAEEKRNRPPTKAQ
ncbi:hypothetical protein Tco_0721426 [Tanacetum coccineum]